MKIVWPLSLTTAAIIGISAASAAPIESVESAAAKPTLQKVDSFLGEQAVAVQLRKLGVSPAQAQARLAKLNDAQLEQLAAQVDKIHAGGDIQSGSPHPLGPVGCIFARLGDSIVHIVKFLFCWTDIK